jgi:integrase
MLRAQPQKRIKRRGKDRFEPRKTYIKGEIYWQVNLLSKKENRDGQDVLIRQRKTFRDHEEAKTAADQARIAAKNSGKNAFAIPDRLRTDALAAAKELEPFGVGVLEAAKFYADHLRRVRTSEKVERVVEELLAAKGNDNLRPRYVSDLKARLNRFSEAFGERPIASITTGELNTWLRGLPVQPATRNSIRLRLGVLFSYAIDQGWCQDNPVRKIKKIKASSTPGILTPEEFARLLEGATPETLPYWLLGGFAGLRRAEVERLEWKDIHFDLKKYHAFTRAAASRDKVAIVRAEKEWRNSALIEVPVLKSKTASRRFVQIQDNLAAWLEPYIGRTGKLCPNNLRKLLEADRTNTGIWIGPENPAKDTPKVERPSSKLKPWPSNGLRHSFASYHLAHFKNAALLALELGHTNQEITFRHYRELVTPEAAEKYWNIRPAKQPSLIALSAWAPSKEKVRTTRTSDES